MSMEDKDNVSFEAEVVNKKQYKSKYDSIECLRLLLKEGYWIHHVTHPATTDGSWSTMVELLSHDGKGCLITVYEEEAVSLTEFIGTPLRID